MAFEGELQPSGGARGAGERGSRVLEPTGDRRGIYINLLELP